MTNDTTISEYYSIEDAWSVCGDLFSDFVTVTTVPTTADLHREILFCLLGGFGITYELGLSATDAVAPLKPFSSRWTNNGLKRVLSTTLESARFEPKRADGHLRKYRFPYRKTTLIIEVRNWLQVQDDLLVTLRCSDDDVARRRVLSDCPGIGLKTASWILRNLGWGQNLAILDVHLIRALSNAGRIGDIKIPRDYGMVEEAFLTWCRELDAPPAAFDLFVWEWQRGSLLAR